MERLIKKKGVLLDLNFLNFSICIDCVRGKLTIKVKKRKRDRKESILQLIHINVYGPISPSAMGSFMYFVTFINDHLRFGWIELLFKKSEVLDIFKKFKATIELKLGK